MNITHDVITDLLPLYLAGEASPDTRKLLEEYLRDHPAFAAEIRTHAEKSTALLAATLSPSFDQEKATLQRVRRFNRRRSYVLAFAITCTLMPFAVGFNHRHPVWLMMRDAPHQAALFALVAAGCWIAYAVMGRRVRTGP